MGTYRFRQGFFTCSGDYMAYAPWVEINGARYRCANSRTIEVPTDFILHETFEAARDAAPRDHSMVVTGKLEVIGDRATLTFGPRYRRIAPKSRLSPHEPGA